MQHRNLSKDFAFVNFFPRQQETRQNGILSESYTSPIESLAGLGNREDSLTPIAESFENSRKNKNFSFCRFLLLTFSKSAVSCAGEKAVGNRQIAHGTPGFFDN